MKKFLLMLMLTGVSSMAAADALLYGGVTLGQSEMNDKQDTSTGIYVGTGILPFIGIEGGYTNHGTFKFTNETQEADSIYLAVRPSIDFGPFHIYGRAGLHYWGTASDIIKSGTEVIDDGTDIMYGFGVEYFLVGPVALGAAYHVYKMDNEVKNFSLTATFHFL